MAKAMLFIDGTWLYFNTPKLGKVYGQGEYHLDFGKLPKVLAEEVAPVGGRRGGCPDELVRQLRSQLRSTRQRDGPATAAISSQYSRRNTTTPLRSTQ